MNYERIIQWSAGPTSILAGWLSNLLMTHVGAPTLNTVVRTVLGHPVAVTGSATAHAIYSGLAFAVGAGLTYAGHHKFLSNVPKWWDSTGLAAAEHEFAATANSEPPPDAGKLEQAPGPQQPPDEPPPLTRQPTTTAEDRLRAQLQNAGIAPEA